MAKRMLIDATHAEETRVVVVSGTRLEEFDVETSTKKQLKGNIYLAKIVRVEPSLQAAFVDYGGGRHGFLAFSEIHPDYYQIPVADRQALIAEQREVIKQSATASSADFGDADSDDGGARAATREVPAEPENGGEAADGEPAEAPVELLGGDDTEELERRRPMKSLRHYKIQEVIKRRQIVLVQVVKEERGNKGAALTTYLSLAGRYCVLMPNTARGGGVSRKITNAVDRKRLKSIANELDIPDGMAVIIRTAGSERTKPEIKRDYEYLLRLWDSVRDLTLKSTAPALVYEEANLIKRSIRDLYSRDIDEIVVDGEEGYRLAKDFMRMLTPSHARKVQLYRDPTMPLFHKAQVDAQLDAMHSPVVQLKSGGYIVINQTEALVAIDVNSGRSTKERHIEETALKTNCEAADEVARQLRLRDLAGLIVIDFIDMEELRNNHTVERRLKEAMRFDRARIQLGKISAFGLLELSRQRLRPSLMETSFQPCSHCGGAGVIRSVESSSVFVLRAIEEEGIRRRSSEVTVTVHPSIALYILNQKRVALGDIEARYSFHVLLTGDDSLIPPAFRMERVKSEVPIEVAAPKPIQVEVEIPEEEIEEEEVVEEEVEAPAAAQPVESQSHDEAGEEGDAGRRRRRRRRRRGRRDEAGQPIAGESEDDNGPAEPGEAPIETGTEGAEAVEAVEAVEAAEATPAELIEGETDSEAEDEEEEGAAGLGDGQASPRRRRRGKRGGRRRHRRTDGLPEVGDESAQDGSPAEPGETEEAVVADTLAGAAETAELSAEPSGEAAAEAPAKPKRSRSRKKPVEAVAAEATPEIAVEAVVPQAEPEAEVAAKPKRSRSRKKVEPVAASEVESATAETLPAAASDIPAPEEEASEPVASAAAAETPAPEEEASATVAPPSAEEKPEDANAPRRRGWWNRFL